MSKLLKQDPVMKKFPLAVITLLTASALITAGQLPALADEATLKVTEIASITSGDGEGSSDRYLPRRLKADFCDERS